MMSRLTYLSELMGRANTRSLTAEDKELVKVMSKEYGMYFRVTGCPNCYIDQVRLLMLHTKKLIAKHETK